MTFAAGGLDIVMRVEQNRRRGVARVQPIADYVRMGTSLAQHFDMLEPDVAHKLGDRLGRALDLPGIESFGRNAGNPGELDQFSDRLLEATVQRSDDIARSRHGANSRGCRRAC